MTILDRFRLDGRCALVTGATSGLGREIARALGEAGANLIINGRDIARLEEARKDLLRTTKIVEIVVGDLGTRSGAGDFCKQVLQSGHKIDVLVNAVGGRLPLEGPEAELTEWQQAIDLNLTSAIVTCRAFGEPMRRRGKGSIINVASIAGLIVNKGVSGRAYETAKAGLLGLTRSLAADWAPEGVRVNAIVPGGFLTERIRSRFQRDPAWEKTFLEQIPMGRLGHPAEIGPLALFLASGASSYVTGAAVVIDGGYTLW
jgi:NAD(P)-dependent dehydrogenase (short-subunit alcohol dehydrogenase family)